MDCEAFEARKQRALNLLAQTGIWKSNYAPPYVKLLWRFHFRCRPPHFVPFYTVFLNMSLFFSISWGGVMWFLQWRYDPYGVEEMLLQMLLAGAMYGFMMATYYAFGRWYYKLPAWEDV